jgi:HSP20 family molecular chaperone IbpA
MNVKDMGDSTEFHVTLPGVSMDDLSVDLKDGTLTISGRRAQTKNVCEGSHVQTEDVSGLAIDGVGNFATKQNTSDQYAYNINGRNLSRFSYNINVRNISDRLMLCPESIQATMDDGILVVTVPKSEEHASRSRRNSLVD